MQRFPKRYIKKNFNAVEIKKLDDKEWSRQQNILINSMMKNAKNSKLSPKEYLKIKGEL